MSSLVPVSRCMPLLKNVKHADVVVARSELRFFKVCASTEQAAQLLIGQLTLKITVQPVFEGCFSLPKAEKRVITPLANELELLHQLFSVLRHEETYSFKLLGIFPFFRGGWPQTESSLGPVHTAKRLLPLCKVDYAVLPNIDRLKQVFDHGEDWRLLVCQLVHFVDQATKVLERKLPFAVRVKLQQLQIFKTYVAERVVKTSHVHYHQLFEPAQLGLDPGAQFALQLCFAHHRQKLIYVNLHVPVGVKPNHQCVNVP